MVRLLCAAMLLSSAAFADNAWIFVRDAQTVTMSGDLKYLDVARKHLKTLGPGYLWFQRGSKQYVVRDGKLLKKVEAAVKPDEAAGAAEAALEPLEAELERHQEKLERHQAAV